MITDEKEILKIFAEKHVIRKTELKRIFGATETILLPLITKGLIVEVNGIGETSYAITQKGMKALEEI